MNMFSFKKTAISGFALMFAALAIGILSTHVREHGMDGYGLLFRGLSLAMTAVAIVMLVNVFRSLRNAPVTVTSMAIGAWMIIFGFHGLFLSAVAPSFSTQANDLVGVAASFFISGAFLVISSFRKLSTAVCA